MLKAVSTSLAVLCLLVSSAPMHAQTESSLLFCSGGIVPDGYIDWTKLPKAPNPNEYTSPTPSTATIPVAGVPGLTVTVSINSTYPINPPSPSYSVVSPIDLSLNSSNSTVTMAFSRPIRGFSMSVPMTGRDQRKLTLSTTNYATNRGGNAQLTSSSFDSPTTHDQSVTPLQIRSDLENIRTVVFTVSTDLSEYSALDLVNARVETGSAPDPSSVVPKNGLIQWLRADSIYSRESSYVGSNWADSSGNHADATIDAGSAFTSTETGTNCAPVVNFNGSASMTAHLPINGLSNMTVFMASSANDDAAGWWEKQALIFDEDQSWGTTFLTPSQTHVFFRFGTTQVNNEPIYTRPATVGGDLTVTSIMHNNETDTLEVNGIPVLRATGKQNTITGVTATEHLGEGLLGTHFNGSIGEILIYNRALSTTERAIVTSYLRNKFATR